MAVMEIAAGKEGTAHRHSFDQCGYVVEGEIEISIGNEKRLLKPNEVYFIPAGIAHNWKTFNSSAKILDVVGVISK
jgi:quercetin dioxygenase-like cupin family protein